MPEGVIQPVGEGGAKEAADALAEAFSDYPIMRFILQRSGRRFEAGLAALTRFFVDARLLRGEPVFGIGGESGLDAVALVSYPDGPASPPELGALRDVLWAELGGAARARYEAFGRACQPLIRDVPRLHLNMIGVRPGRQGRGLGRRLLERVPPLARERPGARGVSLTTEDPANVPIYQRFGYEVTGRAEIAPGLHTWALFRPTS